MAGNLLVRPAIPGPRPHTLINTRCAEECPHSMNCLRGERRVVAGPGSCPDTNRNSRNLSVTLPEAQVHSALNARAPRPRLLRKATASHDESAAKPPRHGTQGQRARTESAHLRGDRPDAGPRPPTAGKTNRCAYL